MKRSFCLLFCLMLCLYYSTAQDNKIALADNKLYSLSQQPRFYKEESINSIIKKDSVSQKVATPIKENICEKCVPDWTRMKGICTVVISKGLEKDGVTYLYEAYLNKAACVNSTDSEEERRVKIETMWNMYEDKMHCDIPRFQIPGGSLIKAGIQTFFDDFIELIVTLKINFNRIDIEDSNYGPYYGTILDYIDYNLSEGKDNLTDDLKWRLNYYKEEFRKAGAKYAHELK